MAEEDAVVVSTGLRKKQQATTSEQEATEMDNSANMENTTNTPSIGKTTPVAHQMTITHAEAQGQKPENIAAFICIHRRSSE